MPTTRNARQIIPSETPSGDPIVIFAIAVCSVPHRSKGHVVETGLSIASVAYGCLLGVFLLGTLTRYATQWGSIVGMLSGFIVNLFLYQATFPQPLIPLKLHIAFTWYVLIGALVTFAIGSVASLIFRKQSATKTAALTLLLLLTATQSFSALSAQPPRSPRPASTEPQPTPDFTPISTLINEAIAAKKLPGAVVLIGHDNQVVFHQAYGNRKLAGEPGLDGKPSAAEPMTEDTMLAAWPPLSNASPRRPPAIGVELCEAQPSGLSSTPPSAKYPPRVRRQRKTKSHHPQGSSPTTPAYPKEHHPSKTLWGLCRPRQGRASAAP